MDIKNIENKFQETNFRKIWNVIVGCVAKKMLTEVGNKSLNSQSSADFERNIEKIWFQVKISSTC